MSSKYPFMLPGVDQFIDFMKLYGIKKSTRVVLYDTMSGYYATRVHWMLRTYGHTQVSVLDGGFQKWNAENRITVSSAGFENGITTDDFNYAFEPQLYRYFEQVVQLSKDIRANSTLERIIDARPLPTYEAGHIDQAIDLWWGSLQNADGTIKTPAEIRSIAAKAGINIDNPLVTSC